MTQANIRLLALDVDGVLTNGDITYTADGVEIKTFNVKDGYGIHKLIQQGMPVAIITARRSKVVEVRAAELGIQYVYQGAHDKLATLDMLLSKLGLTRSQVAYMGDDMPDLTVLKAVGLAACPADAVDAVRAVCTFIAPHNGGCGAVRALCDKLLARESI